MQMALQAARPRQWPALAACMLVPAVSNAVFISCYPLWVVPWIAEFHVKRSLIMAGFGVGNLIMGLASPVVGFILERTPPRLSIALGGLALALGFALGAAAPSLWQILVLYATLMAFGTAFAGLLSAQTVAVSVVPEKAGTIGGLITLGISGGGIVIPALLAGPVIWLGWRLTFLIAGAIVFVTIVPASLLLLKGRGGGRATHAHGAAAKESAPLATRTIVGSLAFWVPVFGIVPVMFCIGTVLTNSVAIATDSGIPLRFANYLVSVIALGGAVGSVGLGSLADRVNYRLVFAATAAALIVSLLLLMGRLGLAPIAVAFAVVGFAGGGVIPLLAAIVVRTFGPALFPRVMGLILPSVIVSMAVAPVIAGYLRDLTGSYAPAFAICAAMMTLSGLAVWFIKVDAKGLAAQAG